MKRSHSPAIPRGQSRNPWQKLQNISHRVRLFLIIVGGAVVLLYAMLYGIREGWFDQDVKGKTMVVYSMKDTPLLGTMKQGMFADMMSVLGALVYAEKNGASRVRVFYDTDIYVKQPGDNYWEYFFEPVMVVRDTPAIPEEVHFNNHISRFGKYGTFSVVAIGQRPKEKPWPLPKVCPKCGEGIEKLHDVVHKYIRVKPSIRTLVDNFAEENFKGKYVVAVHYRGTDKKLLWPHKSPSYESLLHLVKYGISQRPQGKDFVVFLATDETELVPWMEKHFEGKVVYLKNSPRLSRTDTTATDGGTHKSKLFSPYQKGESAVVDCLLLSKAKYLVKNRSSLSDVALLFNEDRKPRFSFILSDDLIWSFEGDTILYEGLPPLPSSSS